MRLTQILWTGAISCILFGAFAASMPVYADDSCSWRLEGLSPMARDIAKILHPKIRNPELIEDSSLPGNPELRPLDLALRNLESTVMRETRAVFWRSKIWMNAAGYIRLACKQLASATPNLTTVRYLLTRAQNALDPGAPQDLADSNGPGEDVPLFASQIRSLYFFEEGSGEAPHLESILRSELLRVKEREVGTLLGLTRGIEGAGGLRNDAEIAWQLVRPDDSQVNRTGPHGSLAAKFLLSSLRARADGSAAWTQEYFLNLANVTKLLKWGK